MFGAKSRAAVLTDDLRERLHPYLGGLFRARGYALLSAGGTEDHIHLLTAMDRRLALSDVLRDLKSVSTGWVHEQFPELSEFKWQDGFGAFSVSRSGLDAVKVYIARQKEHHRRMTFREEFLRFLQENDIAHDPRYVLT